MMETFDKKPKEGIIESKNLENFLNLLEKFQIKKASISLREGELQRRILDTLIETRPYSMTINSINGRTEIRYIGKKVGRVVSEGYADRNNMGEIRKEEFLELHEKFIEKADGLAKKLRASGIEEVLIESQIKSY
jgi:hypothetical protein